jgi:type II secretory pathway component PulF
VILKRFRDAIAALASYRIEIPFRRWFPVRQRASWISNPILGGDSLSIQQHHLLSMLAYAHAHQLEPRWILESFSAECRGEYRRVVASCAKRIGHGANWVEAIEQTPGVLSDDHVIALRSGLQSGTLTETYERLVASDDLWIRECKDLCKGDGAYYLTVVALLVLVTLFVGFRIAPTMVTLEREIGAEKSFNLKLLYQGARWLASIIEVYPWYVNLTACSIAVAVCLPLVRRISTMLRRNLSFTLSAKSKGSVLRILSSACESGRPIQGSLSTLGKYHLDRTLRNRLLLARNELEQGADPWQTLEQAKLLQKREAMLTLGIDRITSGCICVLASSTGR